MLLIAEITPETGSAQLVWPGPMLGMIGAPADAASRHLFGTVGMFMILFGAAVLRSERTPGSAGEILPWATLQKAGASLLIIVGILRHVFGSPALVVAVFDGVSALIFAAHWMARRR